MSNISECSRHPGAIIRSPDDSDQQMHISAERFRPAYQSWLDVFSSLSKKHANKLRPLIATAVLLTLAASACSPVSGDNGIVSQATTPYATEAPVPYVYAQLATTAPLPEIKAIAWTFKDVCFAVDGNRCTSAMSRGSVFFRNQSPDFRAAATPSRYTDFERFVVIGSPTTTREKVQRMLAQPDMKPISDITQIIYDFGVNAYQVDPNFVIQIFAFNLKNNPTKQQVLSGNNPGLIRSEFGGARESTGGYAKFPTMLEGVRAYYTFVRSLAEKKNLINVDEIIYFDSSLGLPEAQRMAQSVKNGMDEMRVPNARRVMPDKGVFITERTSVLFQQTRSPFTAEQQYATGPNIIRQPTRAGLASLRLNPEYITLLERERCLGDKTIVRVPQEGEHLICIDYTKAVIKNLDGTYFILDPNQVNRLLKTSPIKQPSAVIIRFVPAKQLPSYCGPSAAACINSPQKMGGVEYVTIYIPDAYDYSYGNVPDSFNRSIEHEITHRKYWLEGVSTDHHEKMNEQLQFFGSLATPYFIPSTQYP